MKKVLFKNNESISVLGLGCMRLPKLYPDKEDIDAKKAQEIVDYAYAHGVNYFDTAWMYHAGLSEEFIGPALHKYPRESYNLATKLPIWEVNCEEDLERIFNTQLERCQETYFDFYLLHSLGRDNWDKCKKFNALEFLIKKREEGKIRYIGFSFHDNAKVLDEIASSYTWDFAQIQLNYLDWEMQDAKGQYEVLKKYNIPTIIMEPVRGGALANPCEGANKLFKNARPNDSIASWAIRYCVSLDNVLTVLSGMSNMEQVIDNVKTTTDFEPLTKEEYAIIDQAVEEYKIKDTVPCTGCRYCMDCPFGVDIPKVFATYNKWAINKNDNEFKEAYNNIPQSEKADNCQKCGVCMSHCPQSIEIPKKLEEIKELVDRLSQ